MSKRPVSSDGPAASGTDNRTGGAPLRPRSSPPPRSETDLWCRRGGIGYPVRVYLGLGSNRGDRRSILDEAIRRLGAFLADLRAAPLYETAPLEVLDQPPFLNTVVSGLTRLAPRELLERTQRIEAELGRDRSRERRKGPRTLDIDILLYGERQLASDLLTIPHPAMRNRRFVLVPLLDLSPDLRDPETGTPYAALLDRLEPQDISRV